MQVWVEQLWPEDQRLGQFEQRMAALTGDKGYWRAHLERLRAEHPEWPEWKHIEEADSDEGTKD